MKPSSSSLFLTLEIATLAIILTVLGASWFAVEQQGANLIESLATKFLEESQWTTLSLY